MPSRLACGEDADELAGSGIAKIDAVLDEVALVLCLVPFEADHAYVQSGTYMPLRPAVCRVDEGS